MISAVWKQPFHTSRRLMAGLWLKLNRQVTVIGVTGSYGKTSTSTAIRQVLSQKAPALQTDLNLDTVYNLPITLLKLRHRHQFLVLEMGVDHVGEMASYLTLARPRIGVVTGITPVHSERGLLGSLEGVIEEKGKLLEVLPESGWAILNRDDPHVRTMAERTKAQVLWYGLEGKVGEKNLLWAEKVKVDFSGTTFILRLESLDHRSLKAKIGLIGKHFVQAALAAVAVGWLSGLSEEEIVSGLAKLKPLSGRMSVEKGPLGTILLDDHLRANPASTAAGLETLSLLATKGRKVAVLGEMGELGQYVESEHRKIGQQVARLKIDFLICVGPLQKLVAEEAVKGGMKKSSVFWVEKVTEAAAILKSFLKKGDLIYLKGSLLRHMERIPLLLGGQRVECQLVSCHYYHQCLSCPLLHKTS